MERVKERKSRKNYPFPCPGAKKRLPLYAAEERKTYSINSEYISS
jgi:hypothetical protein